MFRFFPTLLGRRKATRRLNHALYLEALEDRCVPALLTTGVSHIISPTGPQHPAGGLALLSGASTMQVRAMALTLSSAVEPLGLITFDSAHHPAVTFEIKDFSFDIETPATVGSATSGAGAGKIKFFEITLKTHNASPAFFKHCIQGTHYSKVTIAIPKAGADGNDSGKGFLQFTFHTVFTTKHFSDAGSEGPEETITFVYGKLTTLPL
jgi:type VI protein secretion system component Hcp